MRLFIKKTFYFSVTSALLLFLIAFPLARLNTQSYQILYRYQLAKINTEGPLQTLFIGDSSLGNGIDAKQFAQLSGQPTLNVALTGLYGYEGSYNMLKAAHRKHPEIKNIIVFQALDMLTRDPSLAGYVRTTTSIADVWELSFSEKKAFSQDLVSYLKSVSLFGSRNPADLIENDYMKQAKEPVLSQFRDGISVAEIQPEKEAYLRKIVAYCQHNKLKLVYMHGPIYEKTLNNATDYLKAANAKIAATGINLIRSTPIGIKTSHTGDHVNPKYRPQYTGAYFKLVADQLSYEGTPYK
jgi:hypothetical protein